MSSCLLCNSNKQDPRCGEFIKKGKIVVHEFCLYLSSALLTNGDDENGLYGFLPEDIFDESKRTSKLYCAYCHKAYANIGCCKSKCHRSFHTLCGIEKGCENQFTGTFRSYCNEHVHKNLRKFPPLNEMCCICYDTLRCAKEGTNRLWVNYIEAPCCRNGWFHKQCLQGFARTSGYFFKCPLCNDTQRFKNEMPLRGIFIPERDAAWELEPNAFAELLERPSKCEAKICKHKRGRDSDNDPKDPLLFCKTCGAIATHQQCLPKGMNEFICNVCANVAERAQNNEDSGRESLSASNPNERGDEEVDVCTISDSDEVSDFLETIFIKRYNRATLSDTDDTDCKAHSNSNIKEASLSKDSSSAGKLFRYESSEDSGDSLILQQKNRSSAKVYNIDDSDESSECIQMKRKKKMYSIIDSTEEDNVSSSSSSECLGSKRRRLMLNDQNSQTSTITETSCKNSNSTSPSCSQNCTSTDEYEAFSAVLNPNDKVHQNENKINVSCVAFRTRHRKPEPLKKILQSDHEDNNNISTPTEKIRTSSSSSSTESSVGYSSTWSTSRLSTQSSSTSSQSCAIFSKPVATRRRRRVLILQKSPSSSSISSQESSIATSKSFDSNSHVNAFELSCIANRTRRHKSVYKA